MTGRASGVLLHLTSLPGRFGIGDLGNEASAWLDWLQVAGQSIWQILPLGPPGQGDSPYDSQSAFAGNPLLISPQKIRELGLIDDDLPQETSSIHPRVDFPRVAKWKSGLLRMAWTRLATRSPADDLPRRLREWAESPEQRVWLEDWSHYAALKDRFSGQAWTTWPAAIRRRDPETVHQSRRQLADEIRYHEFVQFLFFEQFQDLRVRARERGIELLGDLPFYVAMDSCDVWTHPELFDLDEEGASLTVAGVPPDYFSETGQRWGNPIYRWDRLADEGYRWWLDRLGFQMGLVDRLRLDHFRGFAGYWQIPASEPTAVVGQWQTGPGYPFFAAVAQELGSLPFVAEDLGVITPDVGELRLRMGIPGMRVLQFAFDSPDSPHLPHRLSHDTALFTGTHDNDTAQGWITAIDPEIRQRALAYVGGTEESFHWQLLRSAQTSVADLVIAPIQDVLGLDGDHRMNTPGTVDGNWGWRLPEGQLTERLATDLRRLSEVTDRAPRPQTDSQSHS